MMYVQPSTGRATPPTLTQKVRVAEEATVFHLQLWYVSAVVRKRMCPN